MRILGALLIAWLLFCILLAADVFGQTKKTNMAFKYYPGGVSDYTARVQRGIDSIKALDDSVMVTVTAYDTSKSWIIVQAATDSATVCDMRYTVDVVDGTTFKVKRGDDTGGEFVFSWSLVQDSGLTVSRYRGSIASTDTLTTVAITSVDTTKSWVYPTFSMTADGVWIAYYSVSTELASATAVKFRHITGGPANTINYVLQVVTYDSASVQHGSVTPMGTSATKNVAITAIDTTKSFAILTTHHTDLYGVGLQDWAWYATWYSSTGAVDTMRLVRYDNYEYHKVYYQIVSFTDGSTVKPIFFGETSIDSVDVTVASADTARATFLGAGPDAEYSAVNNNTNRRNHAMWMYRFLSPTSVRMNRKYGDTLPSKGKAYIIEWEGWK